jgi:hypothetical protein
MGVNPAQLKQAASELRSAEAALTGIANELHTAGIWEGSDADQFHDEWNSLVRSRLLGAANLLESAELTSI